MTADHASVVPAALPHRRDIDGLRFFAIVPVVLYHAMGDYIPSGFIGVDVFFAISGYLIGGIIYRESTTGNFSFLDFYARRARRIIPALLVVIVFTLFGGLLLLNYDEMSLLAGSAQWTVLGISNIFFFRFFDYFSPDASGSPLLMTWSLGIEEQFYIFFPFVLLAFRLMRVRYHLAALLILNLLSFVTAIYVAQTNPLAGFYLLPARAWELGVGAALAMFHLQVPSERRRGSASDVLAATGLAMIVASCWLFSGATPFPGYAALTPVLGTVILLHTADSWTNRNVLTAPIFVGIGLISYSWYLWHWPLMAYVRLSANDSPTLSAMLVVALLSLGLAYLSWRFVEQPWRKGTLPAISILVRYGIAIAGLLGALQFIKHERSFAFSRLPPQVQHIERVRNMSFDGVVCAAGFGDASLPRDDCAPQGATVALLGDSHAAHLRFGLAPYVESQGSRLLQLTKVSCPPLLGYTRRNKFAPNNLAECAAFQKSALDRIVRDPLIRTVVLGSYLDKHGARESFSIEADGFLPVPAGIATSRGLKAMISELRKAGKHVVVVLDAPKYDRNVYQETIAAAIPFRAQLSMLTSAVGRPEADISATKFMRDVMRRSAGNAADVTVIDLEQQFCELNRICEYSENGIPLYIDDHHLSVVGSRKIDWGHFPVTG